MTLTRRTWLFAASMVGLLAVNAGVVRALVDLAARNQAASHVVLIPLVTFALIWQQRRSIFSAPRSAVAPGLGIALLGSGLLLAGGLSRLPESSGIPLTFMVAGLVVLSIGVFLALFGRDAFRAARFPLLFLAFTIPLPSALLEAATLVLKAGSREAVAALFSLTGTPYHQQGFAFSLPHFTIEIGDACSGIRSSIALLLTSLMAGHLYLRTGWKKAILVTAVLPMAMLKNGLRIVTLSLLASRVDPGFLTGKLHHEGGFVFFLLTLLLLVPLFALLSRSEPAPATG
jgi:exosortase